MTRPLLTRSATRASLLALCDGPEVLKKLPLRQRAGEGLVQRDVGHLADGDAGDADFAFDLLAPPAAVDVTIMD